MDDRKKNNKLLIQIILAIALGIVTGLFFGEYTAVLKPISDIYIMLLQSVVYPYLIVSLVGGFGRMDTAQTVKLFKMGWSIYLLLIAATFFVLFILVAGVPKAQSHIVPLGGNPGVWSQLQDSLQLFIPENPFQALVNNAIPAIVVFSILFGLALQRFKNKESTIVICDCIGRASLQIWNWIVKVAPIGIFALMANTFGTIVFSDIAALAAYAGLFFFGALFLTFVFLPLILHAFVPVSYKEFLSGFQSAILISLSTTLSVAAIPFISKMAHSFLKRHSINDAEGDEVIANSLAISYPICQMGNCFGFLFIFVASAYFHQSLTFAQTILLSFSSFFSSIGSPSATVNAIGFLLDLLHLPKTGVDLYVLLLPFTRYAQVLVSITGMAFFTIAISHAYFNKLKFNLTAFILASSSACLLILCVIFFASSLQKLSQNVSPNPIRFQLGRELEQGVHVTFSPPPPQSLDAQLFSLDEIRSRKVLRVGFNPNMIPWCYYNDRKELVGYDVAFMYQLAKDIHVNLEFIPFDWNDLLFRIQQNHFDIAIGSIYVTSERLEQVGFSHSYGSSVSAFIVRNSLASNFDRKENILKLKPLEIGVFDDPITLPIAKLNFPSQDIIMVRNYNNVFENEKIDAVLWTKGHADAWITVYNGYTSISPVGLVQGWPQMLAYMVNKENVDFLNFLNDWLELKKTEGFTQEQEEKWILRNPPKAKTVRWSIMRNVLHWTDSSDSSP